MRSRARQCAGSRTACRRPAYSPHLVVAVAACSRLLAVVVAEARRTPRHRAEEEAEAAAGTHRQGAVAEAEAEASSRRRAAEAEGAEAATRAGLANAAASEPMVATPKASTFRKSASTISPLFASPWPWLTASSTAGR